MKTTNRTGDRTATGFRLFENPTIWSDEIRLKSENEGFSSYRANLETVEGNQVWQSGRLKSKNGKSVDILIPAGLLRKTDFILSLKGAGEDGIYEPVADYSFTIDSD